MSFVHDGFIAALPVLSPTEAADVRAQFDTLEAHVGQETARIGLLD